LLAIRSSRLINRAAVEELNQVVRVSGNLNSPKAGRLLKIATGDGMALVFTPTRKRLRNARSRSAALKEHPRLQLRMGFTADRSAVWSM
jgi:hypothetical protein